MKEAYLKINGVPTKVVTWGQWVEEDFTNCEDKKLILCIPGNPGITTFYKEFLQILHNRTNIPVWIVSHAGHEMPMNSELNCMPLLHENEQLFNLKGQIEHKVSWVFAMNR